jgi:hypothetical protein
MLMSLVVLALAAMLLATPVAAQGVRPPARSERDPIQHGAQPNTNEVRPGSRDGDAPSAAAGELVGKPGRRLLGLPLTTVLVIAGTLVLLVAVAGVVIPHAGRRRRARGGGVYGGSEPRARH